MKQLTAIALILLVSMCGFAQSQDSLKLVQVQEEVKLQKTKIELLEAKIELLEKQIEISKLNNNEAELKDLDSLRRNILHEIYVEMEQQERNLQNQITYERKQKEEALKNIPPFTKTLAIHPARLFEGTLQASFETAISPKYSLEIGLMGTYVTKEGLGGNYLANQVLTTYDAASESFVDYSGDMMMGYGFDIKLKNFLLYRLNETKKAPLGIYAGPRFMFRHLEVRGIQRYYEDEEWKNKEIIRHIDIGSLGLIMGVQVATFKVISLDVFAGGMMRLSKYANQKETTKYKRWNNIDYSGVLPVAGVRIGILK